MLRFRSSALRQSCAAVSMFIALATVAARAEPVQLTVHTANGTDTSYFGTKLDIIFHLDATAADSIAYIAIPLELHFSNGNILGPLVWGEEFHFYPAAATLTWQAFWESGATDPDSIRIGAFGFEGPDWMGAADFCHIAVIPLDTGQIVFTDILLPPDFTLRAYRDAGLAGLDELAVGWNAPTIVVEPCPSDFMGDVNQDAKITTADIIYLVNYAFRSGPEPLPVALAGDADCNRRITSVDMIWLAAYIFRGGPAPCPCSNDGL